MKKFSKLLAVLVALAVIICPMTSAIVANATANGGTYSIVAEDANNVVLTIGSNDGFIVYQATVTFNNDSAFQSSYGSEGYTNGLKVIDYTLVSGSKDSYNAPAISAQQNGASLVILVSATDAATLDLYSEVQIGIRVASGSIANLTKIQAADEGTIEEDPSLLNFGAKVGADGTVDTQNNDDATTGIAHTHNYTKTTPYEVSAPTCTAYGVYRKTCETCGAVDPSGTYTGTVMADHTPSNVQNATADFLASDATCTEPASYYYECTVCHAAIEEDMAGYTGTFTSGSALGHNMTMHSANAATCTTAGNTQYYSCDRCGKFFSDAAGNTEIAANSWNIAATGHTPVTDAAVAATCTSTGLTEGSHCSVCGATIVAQETTPIDPTNHTNIVEDAAVAPTCVATGKTAGSHCADCGAVIVAQETVAATGVHTWGEYVSNNDATCTVDGTKTATCTVCGVATNTITDTGSAKGHSFTSYTYNNDATCTAAGTETASCDNGCGTTDTRTSAEHPATGHTPVTDPAVAATCTSTGLTEGSHCSVCSAVLVAQTETPIDPTNHTNIVEDAAVAATCTETGLTAGSHCAACDTVIVAQETVNALGHNYTYTDNGDGTHDVGCSRCDYALANQTCVDENDDNTCDLCGADLTPAGPSVEYSATYTANASTAISADGIVANFRIRRTEWQSVYETRLVIRAQAYDDSTFNLLENPIEKIIYESDLNKSNNTFWTVAYSDIQLYALDLPFTYQVLGYDNGGNLIKQGPVNSAVISNNVKSLLANASTDAAKTLFTDVLVLAQRAKDYFGKEGSDCANSASILTGVDTSYATDDYGTLGTANTITKLNDSTFGPDTTDANRVAMSTGLSKVPVINFRITDKTKAMSLDALTMTISYTDPVSNTLVTKTIQGSATSEAANKGDIVWTRNNNFIVGQFDKLPLYCANTTNLSITLSFHNSEVASISYCLGSWYSANVGSTNASLAAVVTALANLGSSSSTYFAQ